MTESVTFDFTSPHFTIDAATVSFWKGARLRGAPTDEYGQIVNGTIEDVLVEGPIDFDAMLHDLKLTRRSGGGALDVPVLWVTGTLAADQIRSGRVSVALNLRLLLVFRVETTSGEAVPQALLCITRPSAEGCWEMTTDRNGELRMFGTPGRYGVALTRVEEHWLTGQVVDMHFEVNPAEHGERVIILRANF